VMVETRLFALPISGPDLPARLGDFRPAFHRGSPRLVQFFGRL
jgi:hypothetical protein